jgi:hypothetical protein
VNETFRRLPTMGEVSGPYSLEVVCGSFGVGEGSRRPVRDQGGT